MKLGSTLNRFLTTEWQNINAVSSALEKSRSCFAFKFMCNSSCIISSAPLFCFGEFDFLACVSCALETYSIICVTSCNAEILISHLDSLCGIETTSESLRLDNILSSSFSFSLGEDTGEVCWDGGGDDLDLAEDGDRVEGEGEAAGLARGERELEGVGDTERRIIAGEFWFESSFGLSFEGDGVRERRGLSEGELVEEREDGDTEEARREWEEGWNGKLAGVGGAWTEREPTEAEWTRVAEGRETRGREGECWREIEGTGDTGGGGGSSALIMLACSSVILLIIWVTLTLKLPHNYKWNLILNIF